MDATTGEDGLAETGMFDHDAVVGDRGDYPRFDQRFPLPDGYAVSPAGIQRNVQLASVLEPVIESPGRTTRSGDCSYEQRFAYFLAAAVNSGEAFRALGERLAAAKAQGTGQPVIYDLAYRAQVESKRQRDAGRTNAGIIEMLVPVIAAQVLYLEEPPHPGNIDQSFEHVGTVLRATHPEDVRALWAMTGLAWTMSGYIVNTRAVAASTVYQTGPHGLIVNAVGADAPTVYDYHRIRHARSEELWFLPFLGDYPASRKIVAELLAPQGRIPTGTDFPDLVAAVCRRVRDTLPNSYTAGQFGDDIVVALYVLFSHFPHAKILF